MSESRGCCCNCTVLLFTLGLLAAVLWLSYRPKRPRFFLTEFQVPRIVNSTALDADSTLSFTLQVENKNKQMGILHDPLNLSLSYGNLSGRTVMIPGFRQGYRKTANKAETADAGWIPVATAKGEVATKGVAVFRVGVVSTYRYKVMLWKSGHHQVKVAADVEVDGEGKKKMKKGIRLNGTGPPLLTGARRTLAVAGLTAAALSPGLEWLVSVLPLLTLL